MITEKLQSMRRLFVKIHDAAIEWGGKLGIFLTVPGAAIGGLGIVVSLLVLFFSVCVRFERQVRADAFILKAFML